MKSTTHFLLLRLDTIRCTEEQQLTHLFCKQQRLYITLRIVQYKSTLDCCLVLFNNTCAFWKRSLFFQEGLLAEKSMNYASPYQFLWLYSTFFSVIFCDVFSIGIFRHPQHFSWCKIAYSEELSTCWQKSSYSESSQGVSCSCCLSVSFSQQIKNIILQNNFAWVWNQTHLNSLLAVDFYWVK